MPPSSPTPLQPTGSRICASPWTPTPGWSPWRTSTSYLPRWHAGSRPSRRQQRMVGTDERDPRCRRDRTPADRSTLPHTDHPRFPALTCRRNPPACAGDPSGDRRRGQRSTHHRRRRCAHPPPVARQYCRAEDDPRGRRTAALLGRHHRGSATDAVPWAPARDEPLQRAEREAIELELDRSGGNKRAAAKNLGISRTTLYKRMSQLGILG